MYLIKFDAIDSTSTFLRKALAENTVPDCTVVWAKVQTQGRGQPGRVWEVEGGKNLTFSLLCRFKSFPARQQFVLNVLVATAVLEVLKGYDIPNLSVKWPNDIMSGRHKLCGLLIENKMRGPNLLYTVIGVGLNVNQANFPNLPQATSMALVAGTNFALEPLLYEICEAIFARLPFDLNPDLELIRPDYQNLLFDRLVKRNFQHADGNRFSGTIQGIDLNGRLLITLESGKIQGFESRTIRFITE
ncbi:MAG: hypothetical protein RLZZ241_1597 [Bacteroidota bacterium]|jgi:BirA family biotin operon repressor/biotin-[acetyl-CoA-carboxylase] ligase